MANTDEDPRDSNEFREIKTLADSDGVIAVITERVKDGRISFAFFREFESKGETRRSLFLSERHIPALARLTNVLAREVPLEEDRARARIRDRKVG